MRCRFQTDLLLYVSLILQIGLWFITSDIKPNLGILPEVPSQASIKAISLGDDAFYFRSFAYQIQNAGDSFGRFTALKEYNYAKLYQWLLLLDSLDSRSNFVPALAGYYFSQTQNTPDVRYIVDYLDQHAIKDLHNKWWWMSQAVYLANHKLKDRELALKLAYKLASTPRDDIPLWVKQMPAFIHEQLGEKEQAIYIIKNILENIDSIDQGELNFMHYFVTERLEKLIEEEGLDDILIKRPLTPKE